MHFQQESHRISSLSGADIANLNLLEYIAGLKIQKDASNIHNQVYVRVNSFSENPKIMNSVDRINTYTYNIRYTKLDLGENYV